MSDRESRRDAFTAISVPDAYDRYMRPQLFEPWAAELIKAAGVVANQRVIDVASGTGVVAHLAAQVVGPAGSVVATDISAPMLAVSAASKRAPSSAPIEFITCSATALEAADGSFDVHLEAPRRLDEPGSDRHDLLARLARPAVASRAQS